MSTYYKRIAVANITFASILAGLVLLYSVYLLKVGISESLPIFQMSDWQQRTGMISSALPQGLIVLIGALLLLWGELKARRLFSWLGFFILAMYAGLFVFSGGGVLIPIVLILLIVLAWQHIYRGS